jgi:hypothetical protein
LSRSVIESAFPRLKRSTYYLTSPPSNHYNCIAWAAGDTTRWWWPNPPFSFWPPQVQAREELGAFIDAFGTLGFVPCADGTPENGHEKVALFADAKGVPKHAARQLLNGAWTSKLGPHEDIRHSIYGLEGAAYGDVVQYLKRPL